MLNRARGHSFRHPMSGSAGSRSSLPPRQDRFGIGRLDLLAKASVIEAQQQVVSFVRRATHGVARDDDAVTKVNRAQHGRQYADVGFRSRDDQRVSFPLAQMREELGSAKPE